MDDFNPDQTPPEKTAEGTTAVPANAPRIPGMYVRERVLIACTVLLIALAFFTAFVSRQYHRTLHRYADQWFAKGESALQAGKTAAAIDDYRNALVYKRDDPTFQFHLAQALASAGQVVQARTYLLNLLSESPGSGPINLTLARLAVRENNLADAVRYYHNAIYGVWDSDPLTQRWRVRRELCEYLLNQGDVREAEPDLIALVQEVPPKDVARNKLVAGLLLRAGLWSRALTQFQDLLSTNRRDPEALSGAGRAAFELGNYPQAAGYFQRLPRENREAPDIAQMLQTSQDATAMDPFRPGLPASEQARRAAKSLAVARARLSACALQRNETLSVASPSSDDLRQLYSTAQQNQKAWSASNLSRKPDEIAPAMSFAFQVEAAATKLCGPPQTSADRALSLIAASRAGQASE
jgi:tetratricopeptide (TPR) repeat protein